MKKQILFTILLAFFISSCVSSGSSSDSNNNWRKGSEGIIMNFVNNNPPSQVLSSQQLNVMIEYANVGTYSTNSNELIFYLTGYDKTILFGYDILRGNGAALNGKDQYNTQGSQPNFLKWETGVNVNGLPDIDSFKQDFTVTSCYHYKTRATPEACLDPSKYELDTSGECTFDIRNLGSNQGAPVAVSKIDVKTTEDKAFFEIHFQNVGKGTPYLPKLGLENCYNKLGLSDTNMIKLNRIYLSGIDFTSSCQPSSEIRLVNGRGFTVCERPLLGSSYFTGVLDIEVEYNYRESITKSLTIINVNR